MGEKGEVGVGDKKGGEKKRVGDRWVKERVG